MARPAVRRRQVLDHVRQEIQQTGTAPSYDMICKATGIGTRTEVRRIVAALETQGRLKRIGMGRVRRLHLV